MPSITIYEYINIVCSDYTKYFSEEGDSFYKYIIIEFFTKDKNEREKITGLLKNSTLGLFKKFISRTKIYSGYMEGKSYLDFHSICQGIYSSYILNQSKLDIKLDIKLEHIDNKIAKVKKILKVKEFLLYIKDSINKVSTNLFVGVNFLLQDEREYKYLREEYIAIGSYISFANIDRNMMIEIGNESRPWDAKINLKNDPIIIEVIQAIPKKEHLTRKVLATTMHGYKNFSLDLRTIHQQGMDSFPQPIIDAIDKKHKKNYPESRVLLVVVLSEFYGNDEFILEEWLKKIRRETIIGNFKEVYLVVDTMQLYQLH